MQCTGERLTVYREPKTPPAARTLGFFFNDTATTEIYTLSLHDALPISTPSSRSTAPTGPPRWRMGWRSEEHTSELQSHVNLVCRLLLEKKNNMTNDLSTTTTNNGDVTGRESHRGK